MSVIGTTSSDIRRVREALGWTPAKLADELGVTPLTVHRWEKARMVDPSTADTYRTSERGRPNGVPQYVGLALSYLMLREGLISAAKNRVTVSLPQGLGSLLPLLAKRLKLDHAFGLQFDILPVETGTDALFAIAAGKAQLAGAATGLIPPFRGSVVEAGSLLRSNSFFTVLYCGRTDEKFATQVSDFFGRTLLFPVGSDVGNIFERGIGARGGHVKALGVTSAQAVEALTKGITRPPPVNKGPRVMYVAWEPLISKLKAELEQFAPPPTGTRWQSSELSAGSLKFLELAYEFHLLASKTWATDDPAAALSLMLSLAQADLEYAKQPIAAIQQVWQEYGISDRDDHSCRHDSEHHDIAYRPGAQLLQLIKPHQLALIDRNDLVARTGLS